MVEPSLTSPARWPHDAEVNTPLARIAIAAPPAALAISLLFGVGQLVVGALLVGRGLRGGRWRRLSVYVATILGVWLACSGIVELYVSGLALASLSWGVPSPRDLAQWRQRADDVLLGATGALALLLLLYPAWRRLRPEQGRQGSRSGTLTESVDPS
jgi:hypothetical protein